MIKEHNDGKTLEEQTASLLKLYPGAEVQNDVLIVGKKVDLLLTTAQQLIPSFKIAVECKDWARPLTREQCSLILADYYPLLDQHFVNQVLLVSQHGIVSNAKALFDGTRFQHLTFSELADQLFNPLPLIDNTIRHYEGSTLVDIYIEQFGKTPELTVLADNFELIYNEFLEFAISINNSHLDKALSEWEQAGGPDTEYYRSRYNPKTFDFFYQQRMNPSKTNLTNYIMNWIEVQEPIDSLAILGSYGTGKSSLAKRIAYLLAKRYLLNKMNRIPLLIELKEFGSHQDIRGLITHELVNRHGVSNGSFELFQSLNATGRFVIILDGFDEMKQGMTVDTVLFNFNQLAELSIANSRVILCGRPTLFDSNVEQQRILTGNAGKVSQRDVKYIQIEICSFSIEDSCEFLNAKSQLLPLAKRSNIEQFVDRVLNLEAEFQKGSVRQSEEGYTDTRDLLSRPVHLPMLASVLPRKSLDPTQLKRSVLYSEFIDAIIEREMLKRRAEFTSVYSAKSRRKFARQISFEMAKRGASRSIRTGELPDELFEGYVSSGRSLEAVKRDLVSACFLERKGHDILYFPHKSFWEFLLAEQLVDYIEHTDNPATDGLGFTISEEVIAFISDMLGEQAWLKLASHFDRNVRLLTHWIVRKTSEGLELSSNLLKKWAVTILELDVSFQRAVSDYLESRAKNAVRTNANVDLAKELLKSNDDVVSVHAYRMLLQCRKITAVDVDVRIGKRRFLRWMRHKWVESADSVEGLLRPEVRSDLVKVLENFTSR